MTKPARYDPPAVPYVPDPDMVSRAQRAMMAREDGDHAARLIRQHWEHAFGAVKVALDVLREIHPAQRDAMTEEVARTFGSIIGALTRAYEGLDDMSDDIIGTIMVGVLTGTIATHEQLDKMGVPE